MIYTIRPSSRFVYDTWVNGSRLGRVMVECTLFMTHCLRLNLQLHAISLVRTCRISSFCTVAWQLARLLLTRRIARSLGDSWASCHFSHFGHTTDTRGHKYRLFKPRCTASIRQQFFVDTVINVWNVLPSTVNFTSLNFLEHHWKNWFFLVFLFVCNVLFMW